LLPKTPKPHLIINFNRRKASKCASSAQSNAIANP